jgi:hypothetical protein
LIPVVAKVPQMEKNIGTLGAPLAWGNSPRQGGLPL